MEFVNKVVVFSFLILVMASCSKDPDIEYTSTYKMSGEWFTRYYDNGTPITNYHVTFSSNTSDPASNQVWVDDDHQWPFKSKFDVDYPNLAFKPMDNAANIADAAIKVKVLEGKVIPRGGRSKSGNAVDSIYLRLEFSDDAGTIYELKGHERTGFDEDEY